MRTPAESARWRRLQSTEARASRCASVSSPRYRLAEDISFAAVVVAELEFRKIQRQVLLADVMIGANHSTLEQTPERIQILGMHFTAHILASRMSYGFVLVAKRCQILIALPFVARDQINLVADGPAHETVERPRVSVLYHLADYVTLPADRANDWNFIAAESAFAALLIPVTILVLAAEIALIYFHDAHELLEVWIMHRAAQSHAHVPSGLIAAAADETMDLSRADAFLAGQHQMQNLEPRQKRLLGFLKDGSSLEREAVRRTIIFAALLALPMPRTRRTALVQFFVIATRATWTIRPALEQKIGPASLFIGEQPIKFIKRQLARESCFHISKV